MSEHKYLDISLSQIQMFLTVAQYGSFTIAAQRLNLTQSAVSKAIASMEQTIAIPLFERKKALKITPAGEFLQGEWSNLLDYFDKSIDGALLKKNKDQSLLAIGEMDCINSTLINRRAIANFQQRFPAISLRFEEADLENLSNKIATGELDAIITISIFNDVLQNMGMECTPILEAKYLYITINKTHPLASKDQITMEDIRDEEFLTLTNAKTRFYTNSIMTLCQKHGFTPKMPAHFPNFRSLMATLVNTGKGIALTNDLFVSLHSQLVKNFILPKEDMIPMDLAIAYLPEKLSQKPALQELIKELTKK